MVINLLGNSVEFDRVLSIARTHGLRVIEDNAQAPGGIYRGKKTGTIGDVGVFSLNIHKTIQTGEGGVLVTNDATIALRARLARNHGEVVADQMTDTAVGPIIGSNYRMTEVVAAMASVQLGKLEDLNKKRIALALHLTEKLQGIPGLKLPVTRPHVRHVYYRYALQVDEAQLGISRDRFVEAVRAEGFAMTKGYVKPLYLLPVFQTRQVFNHTHFPFVSDVYSGSPRYERGICPITEKLQDSTLTLTDICQHPYTCQHIDLFIEAVRKVIDYRSEL